MIKPLTLNQAKEITTWRYPEPFDLYNLPDKDEVVNELLEGSYYGVTKDNKLLGFFCFGHTAQIPIDEALAFYVEDSYTDIGLGMLPDLCGQGLGKAFIEEGIQYARDVLGASGLRLTVAEFNQRAIRLYNKVGFTPCGQFIRQSDNKAFTVMVSE